MKTIPFAMIYMWEKLLNSDPTILVWLKCKEHNHALQDARLIADFVESIRNRQLG